MENRNRCIAAVVGIFPALDTLAAAIASWGIAISIFPMNKKLRWNCTSHLVRTAPSISKKLGYPDTQLWETVNSPTFKSLLHCLLGAVVVAPRVRVAPYEPGASILLVKPTQGTLDIAVNCSRHQLT